MKEILKQREDAFERIAECYECNKKQKYSTNPTNICAFHHSQMTYLLIKASRITKPLEASIRSKEGT